MVPKAIAFLELPLVLPAQLGLLRSPHLGVIIHDAALCGQRPHRALFGREFGQDAPRRLAPRAVPRHREPTRFN